MKGLLNSYKSLWYLLPTLLLCLYLLKDSYTHNLHDFSNSYFPARIVHEGGAAEEIIFDIETFNNYVRDSGYPDERVDFYLNSPFTLTLFYPVAWIDNPYTAKLVFNIISILLFVISLYVLGRRWLGKEQWVMLLIPLLFYVPIRNHILFGQSYFFVFGMVVLGIAAIEKNKKGLGAFLLSLPVLLKLFPVFYWLPVAVTKRWKAVVFGLIATLLLSVLAIVLTGPALWSHYFFDVLPNALKNGTTTDFRFNYQSFEVFLKTLFVYDPYYNPGATWNNERMYLVLKWVFQGGIIGTAIYASIRRRSELWTLLAIWVVALFLIQGRTVTYAQILWIIPAFVMWKRLPSTRMKILLLAVLLLLSNVPLHRLAEYPIGIRFSRLWLSLLLAGLFYWVMVRKWRFAWIGIGLVLLLPFNLSVLKSLTLDDSQYVIEVKEHFAIFDFFEENGTLTYTAYGRNGLETIDTGVEVHSFDETSATLEDHQIIFNGEIVNLSCSLKKKPVVINQCELYFLTDHRSRRGAFTLKKITLCVE